MPAIDRAGRKGSRTASARRSTPRLRPRITGTQAPALGRGDLPLDQILLGDCIERLDELPEKCIDLIFADPPYNLQLSQDLWRPDMSHVRAVDDAWDKFDDFQAYDAFTRAWLTACRRVLSDHGTLWVIGTYHNIHRIGAILQDLGYWILNEIVWIKRNPMPNFRGVRFTNAHETLLWASREKGAKYSFDYRAMKALNEDLQMRSDWHLPICGGKERLRVNGERAHSTQKPEALLYRVILASSKPDDVILDPFFGSGTTGAVAKKLHRRWIGIEREDRYVEIARRRIDAVQVEPFDPQVFEPASTRKRDTTLAFSRLLEVGLLRPGQKLFFRRDRAKDARVRPDGKLLLDGFTGSIHQVGRRLMGGSPCNGWEHWYFEAESGELRPIDELRDVLRASLGEPAGG